MALIFYCCFSSYLYDLDVIIDVRLQKNSSCYIGLIFCNNLIFETRNVFEKMKKNFRKKFEKNS